MNQLNLKLDTEIKARELLESKQNAGIEARKQIEKQIAMHSAFNFALIAFIVITTIVIFTP